MAKIYALVNQKGGVGKTTTAINLGAFLAAQSQRVLLVDLDSQANLTSCLGIDKRTVQTGTYAVLLDGTPLPECTFHNPKLKLTLLPASPSLAGAEVELVPIKGREGRLRQVLTRVADQYDYILVDCPPSLGLLTLNGLVASDAVLIPVQCEYLALEGLSQLIDTLNRVRAALNPSLEIRGLLLTMYDGRSNLSNQVAQEVHRHFPGRTFTSIIPRSVRLAEAPSHGKPISTYAPSSSGGQAYRALAEEVLHGDQGAAPREREGEAQITPPAAVAKDSA